VGTEAVVGIVRADLEPTCWYDEPLARKLSADPLAAPLSPSDSRKLIWKLGWVGRPALDDELLKGVGEGYLAVRQLRPTIAPDTARRWGWCSLPLAPIFIVPFLHSVIAELRVSTTLGPTW
jgi:hypothetical protein